MSTTRIIIDAIKLDAPDADPELIATSVAALDSIAYDDQFGVRRLPGSNRTVEEEARKLFVEKRQPATPAAESLDDERKRFGGYTKREFEALPPDARLRIHAEHTAPAQASWQSKSAPVSRNEILQKTGLTGADFDALPLSRRMEIENEVRFTRGAQ